jgi:hypothetical protein
MDLVTAQHKHGRWSTELPAELSSSSTLVLAFAAPEMIDHPAPLDELRARFEGSLVVGCSTAGEIFGTQVSDKSVTVAVAKLSNGRLRSAVASVTSSDDSREAGEMLGRQLGADDLRGVLVLSDGLHVNGSELVRGLNATLDERVVVTGGLAADGDRFERTWVLDGGRPASHTIVAVGVYGERVRIGHGSKGGWDIFGPERRITRSRGNVLYELDGRPALALYKDYLGERASGLPATALLFPLALRDHHGDVAVVRTILGVNEADQSLTFAGDVPEGALAQLMRANFDRLVDGAGSAALSASETVGSSTLAVAISCVGRRLVLGERTEEEIEATLEVLPEGTQQVGFYSYGELSPHTSGRCELHNQTMTLTTFSEED